MSCAIINNFSGIEKYSYLELGIGNHNNFNSCKCHSKFSVDITEGAMFVGTTDDYFKQLPIDKKFDIIFIDANHDYEYVLRDFNNAINHANRWILIHDMVPPNIWYTDSGACSDSFRLLYYFLREEKYEMYTTYENFGLTLIRMPANKATPSDFYLNVGYEEVMEYIQKNYKRHTEDELIKLFNPTIEF